MPEEILYLLLELLFPNVEKMYKKSMFDFGVYSHPIIWSNERYLCCSREDHEQQRNVLSNQRAKGPPPS